MATILIATMDSTDYITLSAEIEGEGHDVLWASDGQEAIELTLAHRPAVAFIDTNLTLFNGFEVAEILRGDPDVPRDMPLLLFTDEAIDPHRFDAVGFTEHFPKTHAYQAVREILSRFADRETPAS